MKNQLFYISRDATHERWDKTMRCAATIVTVSPPDVHSLIVEAPYRLNYTSCNTLSTLSFALSLMQHPDHHNLQHE